MPPAWASGLDDRKDPGMTLTASPDQLATDPEVAELLRAEEDFQASTLRLIPSENYVSPAVLAASGSVLQNKYSEGYPYRRRR
jgi:glycine hydroxymethyltransferase